jgi:hypothetical protein
LPENNLTILNLARNMAGRIHRAPTSADSASREAERNKLKNIIRLRPDHIERAWTTAISKHLGIESKSHLFTMGDGLSATAVWLKPIAAPADVPLTLILDDKGKAAAADRIADHLNRGEQVLAVDLAFTGDAWKSDTVPDLQQLISATGERPLGIETAQLIEIARHMSNRTHQPKVHLESSGIRSQIVSLLAAALEPAMFSELVLRNGMRSLDYVLQKPVEYEAAPDLFCLDLLRVTNIDRLVALSAPVRVLNEQTAELKGGS